MDNQSYTNYKKTVCDHLSSLLDKNVINGIWWINKKENEYKNVPHILKIKNCNSKKEQKKEQENVVKEYNLLKVISQSESKFLLMGKLHRYAHHLNSSQIMCYNFFRPQLDDNKQVKEPLIKLLQSIGVFFNETNESAEAEFEYEDEKSKEPYRKTSFDFFIKMGETRVYFEIKYTENGFGTCEDDKKGEHRKKFNNYYKGEMKKCGIIKKSAINWNETFRKYYQLVRNAIKVGEKSFVVIITDERNFLTNKQLCDFEKEMIENAKNRSHLICISWQELCNNADSCGFSETHINQFRQKYYLSRELKKL